ncbi:MAG: DUF3419 family protein [Polyangiaceae bacterium]|nr:DUF3419 family protein [Polyangiaceae bacterium]
MASLYPFGVSQEDERSEAAALELTPGCRVLCIASAGEMPLSLLALGAGEVTAVDVDAGELHLTALKLAAVRALPRERALALLGFLHAPRDARARDLRATLPLLAPAARRFWERHAEAALGGPIWLGRFERFARRLLAVLRFLVGRRRLERLFEADSLAEQRAWFEREIDHAVVRLCARVAFDPRVFGRAAVGAQALAQRTIEAPIGVRYFEGLRALCCDTPARENHFLQLTLLGSLLSLDATPACFSAAGVEVLRARADRLRLVCSDARVALEEACVGSYDKIHLSNLADWLPLADFHALLGAVAARSARPGRVVWRSLHTRRGVPAALASVLSEDRALGTQLARRDRYPFYAITPVAVGGGAP